MLSNFDDNLNICIIGASGGIGQAFIEHLQDHEKVSHITALARSNTAFHAPRITASHIDITSEESIQNAAQNCKANAPFDIIIIATGALHIDDIKPEKSLRDLSFKNFETLFKINTFGPALVIKHFLPLLNKNRRATLAALSARVGSISDNGLGGWYAYRASKAALNMILKNAAIEAARRNKDTTIIGLHPGTVETDLSEPFQGNVKEGKLFTPAYATQQMLEVINTITPDKSGAIFAYDGEEIPF